MGQSRAQRTAAYRDPLWRARAWEDVSGSGGAIPVNWDNISVAHSRSHPELSDRALVGLAAERDCTPLDVMLDISLEDDLETRFWSVLANNDPEGIAWLLPRDNVLFGLADSGAHVSQLCDACFATDLLGNWVRVAGSCRSSGPCTSSRASRRPSMEWPTAARLRSARQPTCVSSIPRRSPRDPCDASVTFRPTASD